MQEDRTVNFLWNAALRCGDVRSADQSSEAMKIHLRHLAEHRLKSYGLPPKMFSSKFMCSGCHEYWTSGKFILKLIPSKPLTQRMKLLVQKDPCKLNKYQKKLRELYTRPRKNILELECLVCKNITRIRLIKPEPDRILKASECGDSVSLDSSSVRKKKKKRKRDSFAGLNALVVQMAQDLLEKSDSSLKLTKRSNLKNKSLLNLSSGTLNSTIEELNPKLNDTLETSTGLNFEDHENATEDSFLEFKKSMIRADENLPKNTLNSEYKEEKTSVEHENFNKLLNKRRLSLNDSVTMNRNEKKLKTGVHVNTSVESNLFKVSQIQNNQEIDSNLHLRALTQNSVQEVSSFDSCVVSNVLFEATGTERTEEESVCDSMDKALNGETASTNNVTATPTKRKKKKKKSVGHHNLNNGSDIFNASELQENELPQPSLEKGTLNNARANDTSYLNNNSTPNTKKEGKLPCETNSKSRNSYGVSETEKSAIQNQFSELNSVVHTPKNCSNSLNSSIVSTSKKKKKKKKKSNSCESPFPKAVTPSQQKKMKHLIHSVNEIKPKKNSLMAEFLNSL